MPCLPCLSQAHARIILFPSHVHFVYLHSPRLLPCFISPSNQRTTPCAPCKLPMYPTQVLLSERRRSACVMQRRRGGVAGRGMGRGWPGRHIALALSPAYPRASCAPRAHMPTCPMGHIPPRAYGPPLAHTSRVPSPPPPPVLCTSCNREPTTPSLHSLRRYGTVAPVLPACPACYRVTVSPCHCTCVARHRRHLVPRATAPHSRWSYAHSSTPCHA